MTKIFLIRHAEAEGNLYRIVQGQMDAAVTGRGERQIDALSERFRDVPLDALYSSDLRRTVTTASAITRYHELPLIKMPELREINLGECEGLSFGDLDHIDPVQMSYFNNDPMRWRAPGAETFAECTDRVYNAILRIAKENPGRTVAVVSHGMAIRSFLAKLLDVKSENIRTLPHGDNTAVSLVEYENGSFSVKYYNDNSHLPPELSTFSKQSWWKSENGGKDEQNLYFEPFDVAKDPELYAELYAESWLAAHGNLIGFEAEGYVKDALAHIDCDPKSVLGAYDTKGTLVGIIDLDPRRGRASGYGWISLICLREKYRSKGLGIQLLGRAIVNYQQLGRSAVRLYVSSENSHAIGFYGHYGFERINTVPGCGAPLYLMEKKI